MDVCENIKDILRLRVGDQLITPHGPGTYQGRWRKGDRITHLIVRQTVWSVCPELKDYILELNKDYIVAIYPVEEVVIP